MKQGNVVLLVLGVTLVISGCEGAGPASPDLSEQQLLLSHSRATRSQGTVFTIADLTEVGTSTLNRNNNGVTARLRTTDLEPGSAVTMWWVVFGDPTECAGSPCALADLGNPDVKGDVLYAAGHVVGNGKANFGAHRAEGDTDGSIADLFGLPAAEGLVDARASEVHLVVRTHGPAIPGLISEQIHSFNGGCDPGQPNEGLCEDIQFAIHQP